MNLKLSLFADPSTETEPWRLCIGGEPDDGERDYVCCVAQRFVLWPRWRGALLASTDALCHPSLLGAVPSRTVDVDVLDMDPATVPTATSVVVRAPVDDATRRFLASKHLVQGHTILRPPHPPIEVVSIQSDPDGPAVRIAFANEDTRFDVEPRAERDDARLARSFASLSLSAATPPVLRAGLEGPCEEFQGMLESAIALRQQQSMQQDDAGEKHSFQSLTIGGILVTGPPGAGKSSVIEHVLAARSRNNDTDVSVTTLKAGPCSVDSMQQCLKRVSRAADQQLVSLLLVHHIERLVESSPDAFKLLSQALEQLQRRWCLIASCDGDALVRLPRTLRARGALDATVTVHAPSTQQRATMLSALFQRATAEDTEGVQTDASAPPCSSLSSLVSWTATRTSGFVASDLVRLVRCARLDALLDNEAVLAPCYVESALRRVLPSQLVEFDFERPRHSWSDVGGYASVQQTLRRLVVWPVQRPDAYSRLGVRPPSGVLLHGPSGCGKTLMAHAAAAESGAAFLPVAAPSLFSRYVGDTEACVRRLFAAARAVAPCIVFIDEIDVLCGSRALCDSGEATSVEQRALSQLLNEMDGVQRSTGVFVLACTNRPPDQLDSAILRPGRLEQHILIGAPPPLDLVDIAQVLTRRLPLHHDVTPRLIASKAPQGATGSTLAGLVRRAALRAIRRHGTLDPATLSILRQDL